jgi:hypothetical protein
MDNTSLVYHIEKHTFLYRLIKRNKSLWKWEK